MSGGIESTVWGDVHVGHIVRDKKDRLHTVIDEKAGWIKLRAAKTGEEVTIQKPTGYVDIYVPDEAEAVGLLVDELGARYLREIEEREHHLARRLNWRVDPIPRTATAIRDHLDWFHQMNVDDVWRRYQGTKANPASRADKKAALDELVLAHDAAHDDPDTWPGRYAHHHAEA